MCIRDRQREHLLRWCRRARLATRLARRASPGDGERTMRPRGAARGALVEARLVSGERQRAQQERVEHKPRVVLASAQGAQAAMQQVEVLTRGLLLVIHE